MTISANLCCLTCRGRFLLNPAASSDDHMVQYRFLGILMAVAIRTKKPLDLHLAPWVWKQMCCIPLGAADLEEVDLLTYRSLQGILHLDNSVINEENFTVVRGDATMHLSTTLGDDFFIYL